MPNFWPTPREPRYGRPADQYFIQIINGLPRDAIAYFSLFTSFPIGRWVGLEILNFLSDTRADRQNHLPLLAVTGISLTLGLLLQSAYAKEHPQTPILSSPRKQTLSNDDTHGHPLPNDVLPGARDVSTPYGSIRVYEWGPEDGPKVLFIHGITTPCVSLGGLAHSLVDRGCRVMLFDLFGRGYSDAPADLPQDVRLFSTQVFLALSSSPIPWTGAGSNKFCLVGYSLGGGIAAAFASYFPELLSSLVLLAPSGLLRDNHVSMKTRLLYSNSLVPESILKFLVKRRLTAGPLITPKGNPEEKKFNAEDAITEELTAQENGGNIRVLSRNHPNVSLASAVNWQVESHIGFVHSFMSSMRFGPILQQRQLGTWKRLGKFLTAQDNTSKDGSGNEVRLTGNKVFIICGDNDSIIIRDELVQDATAALEGNVQFKFLDAGHEFPSTEYDDVAQYIRERALI